MQQGERRFSEVADRVNQAIGLDDEAPREQVSLFGGVYAGRDVIIITQPVKLQELLAARQA